MAEPVEVIVCGAGMAGLAVAHQLAVREGIEPVVLIDEREPLGLTSSRGTEAYRNWWPGPGDTMVRFMNRSIELLDELAQDSGDRFELNRRGYVFLSADPLEGERLLAAAREISTFGAGPVREHSGLADYDPRPERSGLGADYLADTAAIRTLFPFLTDRVQAMLHVRRAGFMNAQKLGALLLERAIEHGASLLRDRVEEIVVEQGAFRAVRLASGQRLEARAFVLAAGPLLAEWTTRLGLGVPIVNELHGKIAFEDDAGVIPRDAPLMIWNDPCDLGPLGHFPPGVHIRPRGERTILGIWTYHPRVEAPEFPPRFDPRYPEILIRGLAEMIPGVERYAAGAGRALVDGGYYCKTPDNRPLIGRLPIDGIHLLGALSGYGVMASQAAAELLADGLLERGRLDYAAAFSIERFADPAYRQALLQLGPSAGQL